MPDIAGAEREDLLDRGGLRHQLRAALGVRRIDEEDLQTGFVARVEVIVQRSERVQCGVAAAHEAGHDLGDPHLGPIRREQADALTVTQAEALRRLSQTGRSGLLLADS